MESVYIVSTLKIAKDDEYKLGMHSGTQKKLLSRYGTPLIDPIIYFFRPVNDFKKIEALALKKFNKYRIINDSGKKTEWIKLNLNTLTIGLTKIISENDDIEENSDDDEENSDDDIIEDEEEIINVSLFGTEIDINKFSIDEIIDALNDHKGVCIGLIRLFHFNDKVKEYHNVYSTTINSKGNATILTKHGIERINIYDAVSKLREELSVCIGSIINKHKNIKHEYEFETAANLLSGKTNKVGFEREMFDSRSIELSEKIKLLLCDQRKIVIETLKKIS